MGVTPAPTGASRVPPPALNGRKTDRLRLSQLTPEAAVLIVEGVNQPPPTHVIGDRGIRPPDEARAELATGLAAMVAFGRTALKLPRVVALTSPHPERSGRPLGALGFRFARMVRLDATQPERRLCAFPAAADIGPSKIWFRCASRCVLFGATHEASPLSHPVRRGRRRRGRFSRSLARGRSGHSAESQHGLRAGPQADGGGAAGRIHLRRGAPRPRAHHGDVHRADRRRRDAQVGLRAG